MTSVVRTILDVDLCGTSIRDPLPGERCPTTPLPRGQGVAVRRVLKIRRDPIRRYNQVRGLSLRRSFVYRVTSFVKNDVRY